MEILGLSVLEMLRIVDGEAVFSGFKVLVVFSESCCSQRGGQASSELCRQRSWSGRIRLAPVGLLVLNSEWCRGNPWKLWECG